MSYTTLKTLRASFASAVDATAGLDSFYMMDDSEINKIHNYNYPACVVEIPNSTIDNINRAWEDYEMSCFILKPKPRTVTDLDSIELYDDCVNLFSTFLSNLMKQREGDYVLDRESVIIERITNFGNDRCTGCKVSFNLKVPSVLISGTAATLYSTNLYAHFSPTSGVSRTSSALTWDSVSADSHSLTGSGESNEVIPYFNEANNAFIFTGNNYSNVEVMELSSVSFTNQNFSVFTKVFIPETAGISHSTLFNFAADSEGDYLVLKITSSGTHEGKFQLTVDDSRGNVYGFITNDVTPVAQVGKYAIVGFINDYSNEESRLVIDNVTYTSTMYRDDVITSSLMHIGGHHLLENYDSYGLEGNLKDVVIYDEALSSDNTSDVVNYLLAQD